ncbi:formate dehydrogenase subunit delta [Sagittula sp. S175]|uniref:formate dehydrogenase subunit delta n=1 Tax=Sagittula sp. S175 TaxID=3415129 RepID=UPI003C7D8E41
MSPDKMVRMANQIATFFKTQPGEDAPTRVAAHISDFWEPRMREQLRRYAETGGAGLDDVVLKAVPLV